MGFRFRKSIKVAPGVRVHVSKNGIGCSIGGRGASYTIAPTSRKRTSSSRKRSTSQRSAQPRASRTPATSRFKKVWTELGTLCRTDPAAVGPLLVSLGGICLGILWPVALAAGIGATVWCVQRHKSNRMVAFPKTTIATIALCIFCSVAIGAASLNAALSPAPSTPATISAGTNAPPSLAASLLAPSDPAPSIREVPLSSIATPPNGHGLPAIPEPEADVPTEQPAWPETAPEGSAPTDEEPAWNLSMEESVPEETATGEQPAPEPFEPPYEEPLPEEEPWYEPPVEAWEEPWEAGGAYEPPQEATGELVYIAASGGGERYHRNPNCGNMGDVIPLTESEAISLDKSPCRNCC